MAAEIERLEAAELHLRIDALRSRLAALEGLDEQRRRNLDAATQKREDASRLEQEAAARELPTAERVAEWREWEAELGAEAPAGRQGLAAWVTAALGRSGSRRFRRHGGVLGGRFNGRRRGRACGGVARRRAVWQRASTRDRAAGTVVERRRLLQERLTREVQPALRRANIASLSEFEGARHALDEMKTRGRSATRRGRARRPGGGPTFDVRWPPSKGCGTNSQA